MDIDLKEAVEAGIEAGIEAEKEVTNEVEVTWSEEEAQEAESMGWIPPEKSKKLPEGKAYVGPKEFMERNPLYKQMKELQTNFSQLNSHYQKVAEIEQKKAEKEFEGKIQALKAEKVRALDEADHSRVVEIDEEIRTTEKPEQQQADTSILDGWVANGNKWYEDDSFLRVEADMLGERLYSDTLYGKELLETVKAHLTEKFPNKFSNPNREKPQAVEGGSTRSAPKSKTSKVSDLTADEKTIYDNFSRVKGFFPDEKSKQKYIDDVIAVRD